MVLINIVSHGKKDFICDNCGRTYKYQRALHRHSKYECGKEPQFTCPLCERRFKQKINMKKHYMRHLDKRNE
ncbi:longitudinals lacking protein, isoforms A/B/D/L-like isoform X2 [Rhodnius prolixus]|uniref:longitudinals lacking protein, isoforms A/B/D/L-like isoform X2 n=1 Tax=Rhodnius prolixus TaxID=13249 RepID=UPI003D18BEB0